GEPHWATRRRSEAEGLACSCSLRLSVPACSRRVPGGQLAQGRVALARSRVPAVPTPLRRAPNRSTDGITGNGGNIDALAQRRRHVETGRRNPVAVITDVSSAAGCELHVNETE